MNQSNFYKQSNSGLQTQQGEKKREMAFFFPLQSGKEFV
jgi:hypothetical protein